MSFFAYTDAATGQASNLGTSHTCGFYDPDHKSCKGPNGQTLEKQYISYIRQAPGIALVDRSNKGRHIGLIDMQMFPRCEEVAELGVKMLCFTAKDGRNATGFEFLS